MEGKSMNCESAAGMQKAAPASVQGASPARAAGTSPASAQGTSPVSAQGTPSASAQGASTTKALVLCSGGVDSTTLLAMAVERYGAENVFALSISYGQKHAREIESARVVAKHYGVQQRFLDLGVIFAESNCSLLAHSTEDVPAESYADQLADLDGATVSTYVPFRNGLFLSAAASEALSLGCGVLYYGAHHDDWAGSAYPDCSQAFVDAMAAAVAEGTGGELRMEAPFVQWSKADIVREGLRLGVPYELTWSCYEGGERPCGVCATCIDRARAFEANDAVDPLLG